MQDFLNFAFFEVMGFWNFGNFVNIWKLCNFVLMNVNFIQQILDVKLEFSVVEKLDVPKIFDKYPLSNF